MRKLVTALFLALLIGLTFLIPEPNPHPAIQKRADELYLQGLEKNYLENIGNRDTIDFLRGRCKAYIDNLNN